MRTVAELKRLMRQKVPHNHGDRGAKMIDRVVLKLKDQKYLNDSFYAADYTRNRQENEKFGRRRVQQDLMLKGVHPEVIEKTLASAYAEVNEEQQARKFISRKRLKRPATEKETARIFRMLARAGFSGPTIYSVLKKWNVEGEILEALGSEMD